MFVDRTFFILVNGQVTYLQYVLLSVNVYTIL